MSVDMRHTDEAVTCPIGADPTNYHFEMCCEDCDVARLAHLSLGKVEELHQTGRVTLDEYEGYSLAWALLSPTGDPTRVTISDLPNVRRIARKLIRAKGLSVPAVIV